MEPIAGQALVDILGWGKLQENKKHLGLERCEGKSCVRKGTPTRQCELGGQPSSSLAVPLANLSPEDL